MNQYPYQGQAPQPPYPPYTPYSAPPYYPQVPYGQQPYVPPAYQGPYGAPAPVYAGGQPIGQKPAAHSKKDQRRKLVIFSSLAVILLCAAVLLAIFLIKQQPMKKTPNQFSGNVPNITVKELPENTDDGFSTVEIAKKVCPSVVSLNIYLTGSPVPVAAGSGIIFSGDGYILTNAHVVAEADGVRAVLDDGREFTAKIVGADARTDLAVVRIDAPDLIAADFGDSKQLQVGERTVVVGNAAGIPGSVTQGIVSGLGRNLKTRSGSTDFNLIQTDAAVNPGNSGGALVNRFGQVIGVTSSKLMDTTIEGMCFAIPTEEVQPVVESLVAYGYVKDRAVLGITVVALNEISGPANGLPSQGLYIDTIDASSDLSGHDITPGDVILKAGGLVMRETADLTGLLRNYKPGDILELEIQKLGSGNIITVRTLLAESLR